MARLQQFLDRRRGLWAFGLPVIGVGAFFVETKPAMVVGITAFSSFFALGYTVRSREVPWAVRPSWPLVAVRLAWVGSVATAFLSLNNAFGDQAAGVLAQASIASLVLLVCVASWWLIVWQEKRGWATVLVGLFVLSLGLLTALQYSEALLGEADGDAVILWFLLFPLAAITALLSGLALVVSVIEALIRPTARKEAETPKQGGTPSFRRFRG